METTRRDVLRTIVIAAAAAGIAGPALATPVPPPYQPRRVFPQGIASGDPKPDSVILWTRIIDPAFHDADTPVRVQLSTSSGFAPATILVDTLLTAQVANDRCIRVKVTGLDPFRFYFYRFLDATGTQTSPVGRTKTAPLPDDEQTIRFAFASCQDFIGRYYNSYLALLTPENNDLDFLVHVGDFIYETTGDPSFQNSGGPRTIRFFDEGGAVRLGDPADPFYAARSLSNYRQLYRQYRTDVVLQEVLAKFPLIAIWDDHEFSDDSWQDNGTYLDGRQSERDTLRRRNADRAWLEYIPIDDTDMLTAPVDIIDTSIGRLFPNTRIYRELRFGKTLDLTLTDYRSFRPDHLVAEDAFPATIVATEPTVRAMYARFDRDFSLDRPEMHPYLPWTAIPPLYQQVLIGVVTQEYILGGIGGGAAAAQAKAIEVLSGDLAVPVLNRRIQAAGLGLPDLPTAGLPVGLSYEMLGKASVFGNFGARYGLIQKWFDLFALLRRGNRQNAYGDAQEAFIRARVANSDAHWHIIANSVSSTSMIIDLAQDFTQAPAFATLSPALQGLLLYLQQQTPLGTRITLNADDWDGFPGRRHELLKAYRAAGNVVLMAGDIHSSWVTDHSTSGEPLFEFTGPAISSSSFAQLIGSTIATAAATLGLSPGIVGGLPALLPELTRAVDAFLIDRAPKSLFWALRQQIEFVDTDRNGVIVVRATPRRLRAIYYLLPAADVLVSYYDNRSAALAKMETRQFDIIGGRLTRL
jgi:Phosphodiesterase/alkaline phosphatase D